MPEYSIRSKNMGLYNFQKRFVPLVLDGRKTHTIRAIRKNPDKPGNTLHLFTGLRTKKAKLLMRVPCVKVETIRIQDFAPGQDAGIWVDGIELSKDEREQLAVRDGFKPTPIKGGAQFTAWFNMLEFWDGRLPFEGHIIHWRYDHHP